MRHFCVIELNGEIHEICIIRGFSEDIEDTKEYYFWRVVHSSFLHKIEASDFQEVKKKLNVLYSLGFTK